MTNIDTRILSTCKELADWPLSRVFLKNNADYPWVILVPRLANLKEIDDLPEESRQLLMEEITKLASIMRNYFKPDKLNIGSLGNIVSQLHIHVVARYSHDKLWPHGIWQAGLEDRPYSELEFENLAASLKSIILE